jgi:hypothetical protein
MLAWVDVIAHVEDVLVKMPVQTIEYLDNLRTLYCLFCGRLVHDGGELGEPCEHQVFFYTSEGFAYRSPAFEATFGLEGNEDDSDDEDEEYDEEEDPEERLFEMKPGEWLAAMPLAHATLIEVFTPPPSGMGVWFGFGLAMVEA